MDPKIWGRNLWTSLIHIAQGYPEQPDPLTQKNYLIFLTYLGFVLPCEVCKDNYKSHIQDLPPDLRNRETFLLWLHQVYNRTLIQQEKSEVSFDEFMKKHQPSHPFHMDRRTFLTILLLTVLIFAGYYYLSYKKGN